MRIIRASLLACTGLYAIASTPVLASVDEYSVAGGSNVSVNLQICSAEVQLAVRGDTGTDLDFSVTNPDGNVVHSDQAVDDYISTVLDNPGGDCATYNLGVTNLGEEDNAFSVVLEPVYSHSPRIEKFVVQPKATHTIDFKACGSSAKLTARGDGDTDLDYVVRNSDGSVVHENEDTSDETSATLAGLLSDCETFEMDIANLGEVYNAVMVMVEPDGVAGVASGDIPPSTSLASGLASGAVAADSEGAGDYRIEANSALSINLPLCSASRLEARGDGDTDLDFTINNASGETVHSDFDLSDATFATLVPGDECETFTMEVSNLGDVFNALNVTLIDVDTPRSVSSGGEYRVNASRAIKVPLYVCSLTNVYMSGDGDTDLDFDVTSPSAGSVHSDYDMTDQTQFSLDPGEGCADFSAMVSNVGNVYNMMTVRLENGPDIEVIENTAGALEGAADAAAEAAAEAAAPILIGNGPGNYNAPSGTPVRVNLEVCEVVFLSVEGNGSTDLDFEIYDSDNTSIHSNYDVRDVTYTKLDPGEGCADYSLNVSNLGDEANGFSVSFSPVGG